MKKVGLVMGSESDRPIVEKAIAVLKEAAAPFEVRVLSAHRTPVAAAEFAAAARDRGFGVLVAFAGMAAHLAGALAARTSLPVIGVPCKGPSLEGLDALLSTVQMPSGVPVATVAVNGGANAAWLALQILALGDPALEAFLSERRLAAGRAVLERDAALSRELSNP